MRTTWMIAVCLGLMWAPPALAEEADTASVARIALSNSDQLQARPEMISGGQLVVRPQIAPESTIALDLERVQEVHFDRAVEGPAADKDILRLRDGSLLVGRFTRLGDKTLQFDLDGTEPIEVPFDGIESLSRGDAAPPRMAPRDPNTCAVSTDAGDVLIGRLRQESGGLLVVHSDAVLAKVNYSHVRFVLFPVLEESAAETPPPKRLTANLTTRSGMTLIGLDPQLAAGAFSLVIAGGQRIKVPVGEIVNMAFGLDMGGRRPRRVLAWGAYGDRNQEFPRMVGILRDGLAAGWDIVENSSETFDDAFRAELQRSGVLMIPELEEKWSSQVEALAPELKKLADGFLRRGGIIVLLSMMPRQVPWIAQADLLDVTVVGNSDTDQIPFTKAGRWIAEGVGESFKTCNSTQFYRLGEKFKAEALAGTADRSPIILRQVGRGRIILMGMDYYESNDQTKRVLVNAVSRP